MRLEDFEAAPSKKRNEAYVASMLSTTAPEYSTGEVLLASAYRRLLLGVSESEVSLDNISRAREAMPSSVGGPETWSSLLLEPGGIASPLRSGQRSPLAPRQLMPLVPSIGRVAGVLGQRPRSRWNPSNLLLETIGAGVGRTRGDELILRLGEALAVTQTDDVFARFVEGSLQEGLTGIGPIPQAEPPFRELELSDGEVRAFRSNEAARRLSPAERFCKDLPHVLAAKHKLTRRQWTVLVEAILRLGLGMHALWACNANGVVWDALLAVASGATAPTAPDLEGGIWETDSESRPLLELGSNAEPLIKRLIERYAYARTGINLLLCRLEDAGAPWPAGEAIGFSSSPQTGAPVALATFLTHVATHRQAIDAMDAGQWLRSRVGLLFDDRDRAELRDLAKCDSGYTKNLFEFARHSLGQVKAKDPEQRCYDLAYLLAYAGDRRPLPVQPGPALLVMLVHACCAANPAMPVSLDDFRHHLGEYGLHAPAGELLDGKTGRDLAMLGLVVDSPDAAGGRLLVPPF